MNKQTRTVAWACIVFIILALMYIGFNRSDVVSGGPYKNFKYGFEINPTSADYLTKANVVTNPFLNTEHIQYQFNEETSVSIIKNITPEAYVANLIENGASQYITKDTSIDINGRQARYLVLGYSSGMSNHVYIFDKDEDIVVVVIFAPTTKSPDPIINSFKLS
jgi:hypothetical protein